MSDETQAIDPLADAAQGPADSKPKTFKAPDPKRRKAKKVKEVVPAEPEALDAGADDDAIDASEDGAEPLPDGPGDYRVSLKNCPEKVIRGADSRDHAIRSFKKHYGIIMTENEFAVVKVA